MVETVHCPWHNSSPLPHAHTHATHTQQKELLAAFESHNQDVFVVTYPKSGTTWWAIVEGSTHKTILELCNTNKTHKRSKHTTVSAPTLYTPGWTLNPQNVHTFQGTIFASAYMPKAGRQYAASSSRRFVGTIILIITVMAQQKIMSKRRNSAHATSTHIFLCFSREIRELDTALCLRLLPFFRPIPARSTDSDTDGTALSLKTFAALRDVFLQVLQF